MYGENVDHGTYSVVKHHRGIIGGLSARLERNRLGELLVLDGVINAKQLRSALDESRLTRQPLGRILVGMQALTPAHLYRVLCEQFALRFLTAALTILLSFAGMGMTKSAKAGPVRDVPAMVSVSNASFAPLPAFPELFGSTEKRSSSLKAFTKWTGMFSAFEAALNNPENQTTVAAFKQELSTYKDLPLNKMAVKVNDYMNRQAYIIDSRNYGMTDYWATPIEFLTRGGDCEDYAIAKYTAMRALGVPEERLRIVILQDTQKNIPHAVLAVYTDAGPLILDNQIKMVMHADRIDHYKPIFSINRDAWWLHTKPRSAVTVVASAAR